jgi:MFS transporter, DHA1 family, inner membrane transport protein
MSETSTSPRDTTARTPSRTASVRVVSLLSFATLFVIGTDTFLVAPLLPTLSHSYKVSLDVSGWMVSAYALGYASLALFAGPFSDGRDRRHVLLVGLVGFVAATAACGFAWSFWSMITFRFLAGVSAAFVTPQIWASVPALVPPPLIVRTMGFATAGLSIAQVVGVPLGSWLAAGSVRLPFWVIAGAATVLWLLLARAFPSVPTASPATRQGLVRTYTGVLGSRPLALFLLAYLIFQTGNFEAFSFIGSWFARDFGLTVGSVGSALIALGIGNTIGSLFGSHLIRRLGEPRSLLLALVGLIVLYALLPWSPSLPVAIVVLSVIFLIGGFVFPVFMSGMQARTSSARGTVSSLANAAMYVGTTVGGVVGGMLLAHVSGFRGVAGFTVAAYLAALTVFAAAGAFRTPQEG